MIACRERGTPSASDIDYFIVIWYNIDKGREHTQKGVTMERFGYDFNQKLALAQVSAYCGENVEQARACCHTSPSFERDLFKKSYVMLKGTLEGYEKLFISEEQHGSRGQNEEVREQNQHRREFLQAVSRRRIRQRKGKSWSGH